jgi:hypothetical protein
MTTGTADRDTTLPPEIREALHEHSGATREDQRLASRSLPASGRVARARAALESAILSAIREARGWPHRGDGTISCGKCGAELGNDGIVTALTAALARSGSDGRPRPRGTPRLVHDRLNVEDAEAFTGCTSVPDATGRPRCVNPDHWKPAAAPAKEDER